MAYSDYGAFVYLNGERRTDKEDVGVYDTDEGSLPTRLRIYANIMKHPGGCCEWFEHSHHGVMGDGSVRVGCYKQGWPEVYKWEDGKDKPTRYTFDDLSRKFGWDDYEEYDDTAMERAAQDMIERAYTVGRMESSEAVARETARIIAEGIAKELGTTPGDE
jgi:hypothetical protein